MDALFRSRAFPCSFAVGPFKKWVDVSLVPLRFAFKTALFNDITLAWMLCFVLGASPCYFAVGPFKEWVDVSLVPLRFAFKTALFSDVILAWMLCFVLKPLDVTLLWAPSKTG